MPIQYDDKDHSDNHKIGDVDVGPWRGPPLLVLRRELTLPIELGAVGRRLGNGPLSKWAQITALDPTVSVQVVYCVTESLPWRPLI